MRELGSQGGGNKDIGKAAYQGAGIVDLGLMEIATALRASQ